MVSSNSVAAVIVRVALMSWPVSAWDYQRGEFCSRRDTSLVVGKRLVPRGESLQDQLTSPLSLWHRVRFDGPARERPKIRVQVGRISTQIQGGANHRRPRPRCRQSAVVQRFNVAFIPAMIVLRAGRLPSELMKGLIDKLIERCFVSLQGARKIYATLNAETPRQCL